MKRSIRIAATLALAALAASATALAGPDAILASTAAHDGRGQSVWDTDLRWERDGREIVIQAEGIVFGGGRWDVRRIRSGGRLLVQETRDGAIRRLRAVSGGDGRPVYTYTVDGRALAYDAGARSWFQAIVREFTGD